MIHGVGEMPNWYYCRHCSRLTKDAEPDDGLCYKCYSFQIKEKEKQRKRARAAERRYQRELAARPPWHVVFWYRIDLWCDWMLTWSEYDPATYSPFPPGVDYEATHFLKREVVGTHMGLGLPRSACPVWHGLVVAALVATWVYLTTDQVKMSLERFVVDQSSSTPPPASGPRWVNGKI